MRIRISYNDAEVQKFLDELQKETPRGAAIIGHAYLDNLLKKLVKKRLVRGGKYIENLDKRLTSERRINLCYATGIISQTEKEDMEIINGVRNKFAHDIKINSFLRKNISNRCDQLKIVNFLKEQTEFPIELPRDKYQIAISIYQLLFNNKLKSCKKIKEQPKPWQEN